jgi:hypothetical protein
MSPHICVRAGEIKTGGVVHQFAITLHAPKCVLSNRSRRVFASHFRAELAGRLELGRVCSLDLALGMQLDRGSYKGETCREMCT